MHRPLCLVGLLAVAGCNNAPPAPTAADVKPAASVPGETAGRPYTISVPNMT